MTLSTIFPFLIILGPAILLWMYLRDRKKVRTTPPQKANAEKIGFFILTHILFTGFLIFIVFAIVFAGFDIAPENDIINLILLILASFLGVFFGGKIGVRYALRRFQIESHQIKNISRMVAINMILISILFAFLAVIEGDMNNNILIAAVLSVLLFAIIAYSSFISVHRFLIKFVK